MSEAPYVIGFTATPTKAQLKLLGDINGVLEEVTNESKQSKQSKPILVKDNNKMNYKNQTNAIENETFDAYRTQQKEIQKAKNILKKNGFIVIKKQKS